MDITDRHLMVGLLNGLAALTERLTGDAMVIRVHDDDGNFIDVRPSTINVRWIKKAAEDQPVDSREVPPMPVVLRSGSRATQSERPQSAGL